MSAFYYIGAAIYNQTLNQSEQQHLEHQSRYNLYAVELWAINMAISCWTRIRDLHSTYCIYTDSQAACASIRKLKHQSGQSILAEILNQINNIAPQYNLSIIWVPEHEGISENEKADEVTMAAAKLSLQEWPFKHLLQKLYRTHKIKAEKQET